MALTTFDPITALILIDLQKGIVALPTAHSTADVVHKAAVLADAFRAAKLPVIFVNVSGGAPGRTEQPRRMGEMPSDWTEIVPELNRQPTEPLVTKRTWGGFMHTDLEAQLRGIGVTQVVMAGVATSIGVESTARQAYELGFNVTFAIDTMTDLNPDCHTNSITRLFPRMGETGTAQEIVALLKTTHG